MGGFKIGGAIGGLWERNKKDIAKIAPIALNFIPGVGTLAAAGISAGLNYGANHNLGDALKAGVTSYGAGKLAGKVGGKIPGAQRVQDVLSTIPGAGTAVRAADRLGGLMPQGKLPGAQRVQDLLAQGVSQGGQFLGGNGGMNALGLAQGVNAAMLGQKSGDFADKAAQNVEQLWAQKAPLRAAGIAGMMNPQVQDVSALRRISARGNPFANRPTPVGSL